MASNGRRVMGLVLGGVLLTVLNSGVLAQVTNVTVRVDGLSCPFCAYSLEKKLKAVNGVADLTIDVKEGVATFLPHAEIPVDYAGLPAAVKNAGFTPREIRAAGTARIATAGDQPALVDLSGAHLFLVVANEVLEGIESDENLPVVFIGIILIEAGEDESHPVRIVLTTATTLQEG